MNAALLADLAVPTSMQMGGWLSCLAAALVIYNQAVKARDNVLGKKHEISPQPLDVRITEELVRREECVARHTESSGRIEEVRLQIDTLRKERAEDIRIAGISRKSIYDRIEKVTGEIKTEMRSMPAEIVAQLVNTKQLWKQ